MSEENVVVAVFSTHEQADSAVKVLGQADFPLEQLTIVGKGYHSDEKAIGFYNVGDRIILWGKNGAFWGGLWGLFLGGLFMTIPAIGSVVVLGHLGAMLLGAVEGAVLVGGVSALAGALVGIGIPKDSVVRYEEAVKADKFLVMAHGSPAQVERARSLLQSASPTELNTHEHTCAGHATHAARQRHEEQPAHAH